MHILERDNEKMSVDEIENNPGRIAAKIVYNTLYDNDFELYYIGSLMGNVLYTAQLNNKNRALVSFTSGSLLQGYVNRPANLPRIKKSFGKKVACVKMAIEIIDSLLKQTELKMKHGMIPPSGDTTQLDTVIINPNHKDKFIPINISYTAALVGGPAEPSSIMDIGGLKVDVDDVDILEYDKESGVYLFVEEESDMVG